MSVLLLALSRPVLVRSCPAGAVPLVGKFTLTQVPADLNDEYELSDNMGHRLATVSDSPSMPQGKTMTVYTSSGELWAEAKQDFTSGEVAFYDCAGGIVARLKRPNTGTVLQDRDGNNVAEVTTESLEASGSWSMSSRVTLSEEPQLANEAGTPLTVLEQDRTGIAFQIEVRILGKVWHHTPQVQALGAGAGEDLMVAGRRLAKVKKTNVSEDFNVTTHGEDDADGNPALDPLIVALFAVQTMGYSHYMPAGKLVMVLSSAAVLVLLCAFACCCVMLKTKEDEFDDEGYCTDEDYDSDQERAKVCAPGACCSRGPVSGSSYASLPKAYDRRSPREAVTRAGRRGVPG